MPSRTDWERLRDTIATLNQTQHGEIFRILKNNGINYTKNKQTVLIITTEIPDSVFEEIQDYINFCKTIEK